MTMPFLQNIPPFIFFTGKGGVGKTSLACATAVWLADQGRRTLLVYRSGLQCRSGLQPDCGPPDHWYPHRGKPCGNGS